MSTLKSQCEEEQWTVDAGRCVGSCGLAPVVICDGQALSRATPAHLGAHLGGLGKA
jgi:NADH:ubiquinone oxidoreductase subunit E